MLRLNKFVFCFCHFRVHSTSSNGNNVSSPIPSVSASAKRATFASQRSTTASGRRVMRRHRSIKTYLSKRQIEITKNLFYVLCAFLICISPYLFVLLLDDKQGAPFVPYAATILMFNSCINWVIYATKHPYFKNIFKAILLCRWKTIPEPIDSVREGRLLCMKCRWRDAQMVREVKNVILWNDMIILRRLCVLVYGVRSGNMPSVIYFISWLCMTTYLSLPRVGHISCGLVRRNS